MTAGAFAGAHAARRDAVARDLAARLCRLAADLKSDDLQSIPIADMVLVASLCLEPAALAAPAHAAAPPDPARAAADRIRKVGARGYPRSQTSP